MKRYVSWDEVNKYVEGVYEKYKHKDFTGIYGIPRGGMVLATMLSYKFSKPLLLGAVSGCLIVDDICDSGESLIHYSKDTSGNEQRDWVISTMFYRKNDMVTPDFHMFDKENDWIVFPWEEVY